MKCGARAVITYIIDTNNYSLDSVIPKMVSLGLGRTTCSYFMPGDSTIIYASTHLEDAKCPHVPERRVNGKYVWPIYDSYDIFIADLDGNIVKITIMKDTMQKLQFHQQEIK